MIAGDKNARQVLQIVFFGNNLDALKINVCAFVLTTIAIGLIE
jgi:hypothetical protein